MTQFYVKLMTTQQQILLYLKLTRTILKQTKKVQIIFSKECCQVENILNHLPFIPTTKYVTKIIKINKALNYLVTKFYKANNQI